MRPLRLGKADCTTYQACDARPQPDMLALDLLGVVFANRVLLRCTMTLESAPAIRIRVRDAKRLSQRFALQKNLVLTSAKYVPQHCSRVMINRMPQPAWIRFARDKAPHFIEF